MPIRIPAVIEIPDDSVEELREALVRLSNQLEARPKSASPASGPFDADLPLRWKLIETQHRVVYSWGTGGDDLYDPFWIYEGETHSGTVRLAIGECDPTEVRDRKRKYLITHRIGPAGGKRAIAEFLATDDHETTGELIAIVKGKDGGGTYFDPDDRLPAAYDGFRIETYRDRIDRPGSYRKAGLVVAEQDHATMLNHTLIQIRLRGLDD